MEAERLKEEGTPTKEIQVGPWLFKFNPWDDAEPWEDKWIIQIFDINKDYKDSLGVFPVGEMEVELEQWEEFVRVINLYQVAASEGLTESA